MICRLRKAQTSLEYTILITIVLAAFLAIGNYVKRGLQGRWKSVSDDLGDQYDPRAANTTLLHTVESFTDTTIATAASANGYWTTRMDLSNTMERKEGYISVGAY